jgi:hypothetical protein
MQITVAVTDANNIVCTVVPPQTQTITIDRGVAGNGIVSIVPVTISTFQYLRITYTNGTVSDVGPLTSTAYTATSPITIVGNTISLSTVPIASGGTAATTAAAAIQNLLPSYTGNGSKRLGLNSGATALEWVADGNGTVTSVALSGGSTGFTTSGGPITSSGTITLAGTLAIANGGSGQITAQLAINAFAGAVTSGSYLRGNGTNVVMATIQAADVPTLNQNTTGTAANITATSNSTLTTLSALSLPGSQVSGNISGNAANVTGTVAIGNGGTGQITANAAFNALAPSQTGNSGKYLTTDGTNTSWATNPLGTVTSVAATVPSFLSITGSPITTSGTLAIGLSGTALPTANGGTGLTSFTANGVVYASSSSALTTGSALTFDGSTFTVGGTAQTGYKLQSYTASGNNGIGIFNGSNSVSDFAALSFIQAGNQQSVIYTNSSNLTLNVNSGSAIFQINSAEQMRLTSTGLVIGGTSTTYKLDVNGAAKASYFLGPNDVTYFTNLAANNGIVIRGGSGSPANQVELWTGGGAKVYLDSSGNLGLGVTPSAYSSGRKAFEIGSVGNGIHAGSGGNTQLDLVTGAYYNTGWKYAATNAGAISRFSMNDVAYGQVEWYTAPQGTAGNAITFTQAMTLDASGILNVGTTGNNFHTFQLNLANGITTQFKNTNTTNGYGIDVVSASAAGTGWALMRGYASSSTQVYGVYGNGNVVNTNNSYGAISDVKLKENIVDASPKLADMMQVKIRNYNLKTDPDHKQLGVIAQELEAVFPAMVEETADKDMEGNDLGTTTKSVKYSVFVPMLIKAIQELKAEFDAYKSTHP